MKLVESGTLRTSRSWPGRSPQAGQWFAEEDGPPLTRRGMPDVPPGQRPALSVGGAPARAAPQGRA